MKNNFNNFIGFIMSQKLYSILMVLLTLALTSIDSKAGTPPSTQAYSVVFSNVNTTSMRISWINGNGGNRIVTITPADQTVENPSNGDNYTANTNYGSAGIITTNTRVVYNGSGRTRTVYVSGLTSSTSYTVKVYEYNFSGGQRTYQTADASNNPRGVKTAIAAPANIEFTSIGYSNATATWSGGTSNDMILSLYNLTENGYHLYYEEANLGDVSNESNTFYSYQLSDLDMDIDGNYSSGTFLYGVRIKAKDGSEESAWYPANFTSSTFQTIEDNTDPSFTYSIHTSNTFNGNYLVESSTLTPGTYYLYVKSSELLYYNPTLTFTPDAADGSDGTDFDFASATITNTLSDTEWYYEFVIPTANYDVDNSVNSEATTFTIHGYDYALNPGNESTIDPVLSIASYYIDNRPPYDLAVYLPSGTFGISNTVTATITLGGNEESATFGSMTFNGVDVASEANFNELGSGSYTIAYEVSESDIDTEFTANWNSLSFSMIDEHGNSSTFVTTASIGGSNTLTIDANSPTVTMVYLPSDDFAVGEVASVTFTALGAGESTTVTTGEFNGQTLSSWTYIDGGYKSGETSTFTANYTVVEGDLDLIAGSGLTFSIQLTDQANNTGLIYNASTITPNNLAGFDVDANSPTITALYLPSSTFGIGDIVTATITMSELDRDDADYSISLTSATINNVEIANIYRLSGTTYTASFTVPNEGTDYIWDATEDVSLSFTINDTFDNSSNLVEAAQASGSITIDANKPHITAAWIPSSGAGQYGIGSTFNIDLVYTDSDDITIGSATFNTGNFTKNEVESTATYSIVYTVANGHPNIFNATSVPGTFTLTDKAGNTSTITNINANVFGGSGSISIVGTRPTIEAVYFTSDTYTVGETITATITVGSSNASDLTNFTTTFNMYGETFTLNSSNTIGSGSYTTTINITDKATSYDVANISSLSFNIWTVDSYSNSSVTYNDVTTGGVNTISPTLVGGNDFVISSSIPIISSVSIPSGNYKVGDHISATITTDSDSFGDYLLTGASASINNVEITDFTKLNTTSYAVTYTVGESNDDRAAIGDIPTWFRVQDVHGNTSSTFTGNLTSTGAVTIDANTPIVDYVTIQGGNYGIGDEITVTIVSGESTPSSSFNAPLESATITINGIATTGFVRKNDTSTEYDATYTVLESHTDRAAIGDIPISVKIKDPNGNISNEYTTSATVTDGSNPTTVQIDATKPVISAIYLPSGTFNLDDVSEITVTFTVASSATLSDANYTNSAHTFTINGYEVTNFANLGSNSYSASWTIVEGQDDHNGINSLTFNISTSDTFGNSSLVYNDKAVTGGSNTITPSIVGGDGSFIVDANRPQIASATVTSGLHGINDQISITFSMVDAADHTGVTLVNNSSSFNSQSYTSFTENGGNLYTLKYTVVAGHNDVASIDLLSASITVLDKNGNSSLPTYPFWSPDNPDFIVDGGGAFSIDANAPTITAVYVDGGLFGFGETITATITTDGDETGLNLYGASSSFNGNGVTGFTDNSGSYTVQYTVVEGDSPVSTLADLTNKATFTLIDDNGNLSNSFAGAFNLGNGSTFSIDAVRPNITSATVPSNTFGIGGTFTATFTVDKNYIVAASGSINNETFTNATFVNDNYFTVTYTVVEGNSDRTNGNQLPYSATITDEYGNISNAQTNTFTANANFAIDANRPYVDAITFESGKYGIGTTLTATFTVKDDADDALEAGLTITSASVNSKDVLASIQDIGSGSYTLAYVVEEGDSDQETIDTNEIYIVVKDAVNNSSTFNNNNPITVNSNGTSIDATKPVINNIYVEASDNASQNNTHKIGDEVTINVVADTDSFGGVPYTSGTISINGEDEGGTLSHNSGTYTFTYTVTEGNTDRTTLASTPMTFTLVDNHGNSSTISTQNSPYVTNTGTNFKIDANKPIYIVDYLTGINKLTSPLITNYPPYVATADERFTIRLTTNENVRYNLTSPSATPTIVVDAQGSNNDINGNLTFQGTVGGTTTFTINRTISEDLATNGTVSETVTAVFTDLAGNTSTSNPINAASRSFNIDATKPNFTFTYYTDAGFTTEIPVHGRIDAGTYYIKIEADELVKPLATFTIVNPESVNFNVTEVFNVGVNTTTFSYARVINDATTVAGLTSETYTITSEDVIGNKLVSGSFTNSDSYLVYVDTQDPTATVTVAFENTNSDIVTRDKPSATVSVVYDEDMDQSTSPSITFTNDPIMISDGAGSWATARTFTQSFTHDLTEELKSNVSATINTVSGATDVAGNTDIGAKSPTFTVNTQTAIASASITLTVFESENVINYDNREIGIKVFYDRTMDSTTTPSLTFTNNANFTLNNGSAWDGSSTTWSATYTHSGTEFKAEESATVSGSDVNGARDNVGNLARGVESSTFRIDTELPTVSINAPASTNNNSATIGNSSVTFTYVVNYADNNGLHAVTLSTNDITVNEVSGDVTSHSISVANNGTNSSTVSIYAAEGDGYLSITIGEDVVTDLSGNGNIFSAESATIQIDNTAPVIGNHSFVYDIVNSTRSNTLTIDVSGADYNNAASNSFTFALTNATGGTVNSASNGSISQVNVAFDGLTADGSASITMATGVFSDIAGNINSEFTTNGIEVDNTAPTLVAPLTITNIDNTNMWFTSSEILYTDNLGASLTLVTADFAMSASGGNASLSSFTYLNRNSNTYTFDATWTGEFNGSEAITINANGNMALYDRAGNALLSSSTVGRNALVRPTITFNAPTPQFVNSAGTATFTIDLTNTATNKLDNPNDFAVIHSGTGGANAVTYLGGDNNTATITITGLTGNGSASISVPVDKVLSPEEYGNLSRTTTTPINVDNIKPIATIGAPSLTYTNGAGTFTYLVSYSDENSGLNLVTLSTNDITFDVKNGTITSKSFSVINDGTNSSTVTLWAFEGSGDIAIKVGAGVVTDNATNSNTATGFSNYVTIDNTPPSNTLTITNNGTTRSVANDSKTMTLNATFNEPIDENINVTMTIEVPGSDVLATFTRVTESSYTYSWDVDQNGSAGDGSVTFTFTGGTDLANNAIASGTTTVDPFTVDNTAPTITSFSFTNVENTTAVVTFSEGVYGTNTASGNYGSGALDFTADVLTTQVVAGVGAFFAPGSGSNHTPGSATWNWNNNATNGVPANGTEAYTIEPRTTGAGAGVYDFAGNLINSAISATATMNKKASIQDVSIANADATYGIGTSITFNLEFDFVINSATSASMSLNNGGTAVYQSGEGSNTISLVYTVDENATSQEDLVYSSTTSISPTNVFTDNRGYNVTQTLPATTTVTNDHQINVDTQRPVVTIGLPSATLGNDAATFTYVLTHSDNIGNPTVDITTASITYDGIEPGNTSINTVGTSTTVSLWNIEGDGYTAIKINAGVLTDGAGNTNIATNFSNTITIDNTDPVVTFTSVNPSIVNSTGTVTFTYTVSDANSNTNADQNGSYAVYGSGGSISSANVSGNTSGTVTATGFNAASGSASISINAGVFTDAAGNSNTITYSSVVNVDNTVPTATLVSSLGSSTSTTNQNTTATLTFSEGVTGLSTIQTSNAGVSITPINSVSYTIAVTAYSPGIVKVWLNANQAQDNAGNGNTTSNTISYNYEGYSFSQVVLTNEGTSSTVSMGSTNRAFTLEINDDKGQGTDQDGDDLPTIFTNVTVGKSGSYNLNDLISSATFFNNSGTSLGTASISENNLTFNVSPSQTITDDATATYYVSYTLNSSSTYDVDNLTLTFTVNGSSGISTAVGSTPFDNVTKTTGGFTANQIKVNATKLAFGTQPQAHTLANGATFTVKATDANGNLDKDFTGVVTIGTNSTFATNQTTTFTASAGVASMSAVKFNNWISSTNVSASVTNNTNLTPATSNTFSIRANAPSGVNVSTVTQTRLTLNTYEVKWAPSLDANGNHNKALVVVRELNSGYPSNYALSNSVEADIDNYTTTLFTANTTIGNSTQTDNYAGNGSIVLFGQGEAVGSTHRRVVITNGTSLRRKSWSVAIYMFDGDISNQNTIAINTDQASLTTYFSKEIFDFEDENTKYSENNLFSVSVVNPNPVVDEFSMNMTLNENLDVTVDLYSTSGQMIGNLYQSSGLQAGSHVLFMNMNNFDVSSGTYMLQIRAGEEVMMLPFVYKK